MMSRELFNKVFSRFYTSDFTSFKKSFQLTNFIAGSSALSEESFEEDFTEENFLRDDLKALCKEMNITNEVAVITSLFVKPEERRKGLGSEILKNEIVKNPSALFIVRASALREEYDEELTPTEYDELFKKLIPFFEVNGFKNINSHIGQYECSEVYLYTSNTIGKEVYDYLNTGVCPKCKQPADLQALQDTNMRLKCCLEAYEDMH